MVETLYSDTTHRIDFFACGRAPRGLVYTFTAFAFTNLDAPGFGVQFLLDLGYDVVAVKCNTPSWYQGLDLDTLRTVGRRSKAYDFVATYGSSMGGYGAILFSRAVGAHLVLALSPQFSLAPDFEPRWRQETKDVVWRHQISAQTVAPDARYMILYDDKFALDIKQMEQLRAVLPQHSTQLIGIPFSSHHTIVFLVETGQLTAIVTSILRGEGMIQIRYPWSKVGKSADFFHSLGMHARTRGKMRLARMCLRRCVALRPKDANFQRLLGEMPG